MNKHELSNRGTSLGYQPHQRSSRVECAASAYFEQFGPGIQSLRMEMDPAAFSDIFSSIEISAANERLAKKREHHKGDKTEHGQEAEVVFLQLLRDYKLLGKDARIIPTSEYDDELPGIDFIIELPWRDGTILHLGIDTTTTEDKEKIAQKERGGQQKTLDCDGDPFSYCDGAVRKALFFKSDNHSGTFLVNNTTKRGILVPLVVVQMTREEIDIYLSGVYKEDSKALRNPRQCENKKEVVESCILVLIRMLSGIESQIRRLGLANPLVLFPKERALNKEMTSQLQKITRLIKHSLNDYQQQHPEPMSDSELSAHYEYAHSAIESIKTIHSTYPSLIQDIKRKNPHTTLSLKALYQAYKKEDLSAFDALSVDLRDAEGSSKLLQDMPFGEKTTVLQKKQQEIYKQHFTFLAGFQEDERFKQRLKNGDRTSLSIKRSIGRLIVQREFFEFLTDYLIEGE